MRSWARIVISLPIMFLPWTATGMKAAAQEMGPEAAMRQLAQARSADQKCGHLASAEHDELAGYAAKAEIAVAQNAGVSAALEAVSGGKLAGELMTCGAESQELVRASLAASRAAMAYVAAAEQAPQVQDQAHSPEIVGSLNEPAEGNGRSMEASAVRSSRVSLSRYLQETTAYYLERRCRHLRDRQTRDFWERVVDLHQAAVGAHGGSAVGRAKMQAEAAAAGLACGPASATMVRAAYTGLRQN
jgi:hypothetical protein